MPKAAIDWPALATRYETSDVNIRQLAKETGVSERAIAARSSSEKWRERRVAYRERVASKAQRRIESAQVADQVKTLDLVKSTARLILARIARLVQADALELDANAFDRIARLVLLLEGQLPAESLDVRMRQLYGKAPEEMDDAELDAALADAVDEELRARSTRQG